MGITTVRYTVKAGREARNEELVRAVYEELAEQGPDGFRYATFRLDEGPTFVHFAVTEGDAQAPLPELPAFQEFQRDLEDRCEVQPVVSRSEVVGAYRMLELPVG
jgi:hypothetical protein